MNHSGDDNKMVDTPRMNSVAGHARGIVDAAIFAEGMKLERELNAANERIKRLEEAGQRVDDAAHSIQDWSGTVLGDALDELNKAKEAHP